MKKLIIAAWVLVTSCGTVQKTTHTATKTTDSSYSVYRDSSYKSTRSELSDDFSAKDVDITVWYDSARCRVDPGTAAILNAPVGPGKPPSSKIGQYALLIQNAITAAGTPAKLQIHIGSVSDSSGHSVSTDTGSARSKTAAEVATTESVKDKETKRVVFPWWAWLVVVAAMVFLAYRVNRKFQIIKL